MERCVLITGCSSGVGRATATAFREEDWEVMATARDPTDIRSLAERGCHTAALDVTDPDQVTSVVERSLDICDRLDCLVNNAGYSQVGPLEDIDVQDFHRQFDTNVYGPHRLTRAVLPHMRDRNDGTIVNVSSVFGRVPCPGCGVYSASKFALEAMSEALRAEVSTEGIDVVIVTPGTVETRFRARARAELAGIERTAAYESLYRVIDDWAALDGFEPTVQEPRRVADAIVNAASATDPDPRYTVGETARLLSLGRIVPAGLRDALYRGVLRVTSVRRAE